MKNTKVRKLSDKINRGPKFLNYYLHASKEDNWDEGKSLKLSEEALKEFEYTGYEVHFYLQVNEDGTNKVLEINDIDVSDKNIRI